MSISVFLPLRSGSRRVLKKNTRPFAEDGRSLFQIKLDQVLNIADTVDEIIVSTDDEEVAEQLDSRLSGKIKLDWRPAHLCQSDTRVVDLINYVPKVAKGEHVFWLHATSPFVDSEDYKKAIDIYKTDVIYNKESPVFDSLMSVNRIQQFIWDDKKKSIINCDRSVNPWPNTQDLDPLYEINHAFYISSKNNYINLQDRIGKTPCLYICEGLKRMDIDWEEDFFIAQKIYNINYG